MKKKKKIRNLTDEDMQKICDKYLHQHKICCDCPLVIGEDSCLICIDLDKEVEVEE